MDTDEINRLIDEGRATVARELRGLADRLETMPIPDVGEAMAWLEPTLEAVRRWAERVTRPGV